MSTLNFVPESITVSVVSGASLAFSVAVTHADGTPYDLSGYALTAPIQAPTVDRDAPGVTAFALAETNGTITLSLTADETQLLGAAYIGAPVAWSWYVWAQESGGGGAAVALVRGSLLMFRA